MLGRPDSAEVVQRQDLDVLLVDRGGVVVVLRRRAVVDLPVVLLEVALE